MFHLQAERRFPAGARASHLRRFVTAGVTFAALLAGPSAAAAADVHVSPAGADDEGCGTLAAPCQSLD